MKQIPRLYLIAGAVVLVVILSLGWFVGFSRVWNGIGNALFHRQINAERIKVQKELEDAAAQKKLLEQTLLDYKAAKEDLAAKKAETERLEKLFNDMSKTASQKVAEFKAIVAAEPTRTSTDGVTLDALCERAKAAGASAATIAALCS